jgi:hypothetical protein
MPPSKKTPPKALVRARLRTKAQHAQYDAFLKAGGKGCFVVPNVVKFLNF